MHKHDMIKTGEKIIPKKMEKSWGPPKSPRVPMKFLNMQIVITKQITVSTVRSCSKDSSGLEQVNCGGPKAKLLNSGNTIKAGYKEMFLRMSCSIHFRMIFLSQIKLGLV